MRHTKLLAAMIVTLGVCSSCSNEKPEEWIPAFESPDGNMSFDANSIRNVNGRKAVNVQGSIPPTSPENIGYAKAGKPLALSTAGSIYLDCARRTMEFVGVGVRFADGQVVKWPKQEPEQIKPGSPANKLLDRVCSAR